MAKNFFSAIKKAESPKTDYSKIPRGNVAAKIISIDTVDDKFGWLMNVEIVSGQRAVGEKIQVTLSQKGREWAETGKLDTKIEIGSEVILQNLTKERNSDVYVARRVTALVLDHAQDAKKGREVLRRVPHKLNFFAGGAVQMVIALPDTKAAVDNPDVLEARIAEDLKDGNKTMIVGKVGDTPFYVETIEGKRDGDKFVQFDASAITHDVLTRINRLTAKEFEKVEEGQEDDLNIEMTAYSLKSLFLGKDTRDALLQKMDETGRFSTLPVDAMIVRPLEDHVRIALGRLEEPEKKRLISELAAWVGENADSDEKAAYKASGIKGLSEKTLSDFLTSIDVTVPKYQSSLVREWDDVTALRSEENRNSKNARSRLSTGWVVGDVVTQQIRDKKTKAVVQTYPAKSFTYSENNTASPFFPDRDYLADYNSEFFKSVYDGVKLHLDGAAKTVAEKPQVQEMENETDADQALAAEIEGLVGSADFDLDDGPSEDPHADSDDNDPSHSL